MTEGARIRRADLRRPVSARQYERAPFSRAEVLAAVALVRAELERLKAASSTSIERLKLVRVGSGKGG